MLGVLLAGSGWANSITQHDPIYDSGASGNVQLYVDLTNDDSGAVYDSYETCIFSNLVTTLWAVPENQIAYSNQTAMCTDWGLHIFPADVHQNWEHDNDFENLEISHFGLGYDHWTSSSDSDMMRLGLSIPLSQLDGDGDGWSAEDPMDFQIGLGAEASEMGVGHQTGGFPDLYAAAEPYEAVLNPQATSNGTSILWLEGYGFSNDFEAASVGNPDGDRYPTVEEYTLDTNPTNATPAFALSFPGGTNPAVMTFSPSSTGRTYTVWHADGMVDPDWTEGTTCTGSAGSTTITNTLGLGPQYLQLRVNQP